MPGNEGIVSPPYLSGRGKYVLYRGASQTVVPAQVLPGPAEVLRIQDGEDSAFLTVLNVALALLQTNSFLIPQHQQG